MLTDAQKQIIFDLERVHLRWLVWVVNTATGGPIWCARMKHDHSARMVTLINTGSSGDLDKRMTELEAEFPRLDGEP